jgi:hypothetical protein
MLVSHVRIPCPCHLHLHYYEHSFNLPCPTQEYTQNNAIHRRSWTAPTEQKKPLLSVKSTINFLSPLVCQNEVSDLKPRKISKVRRRISRNNMLYYGVRFSCQRQISPRIAVINWITSKQVISWNDWGRMIRVLSLGLLRSGVIRDCRLSWATWKLGADPGMKRLLRVSTNSGDDSAFVFKI